MRIEYDADADAMYIELTSSEFSKNKVIDPQTIIDFDKAGNLIGIELLNVSKRFPHRIPSSITVENPSS